jgi:hypothetical protein
MADPYIGAKTFLTMRQRIPYAREIPRDITRPFEPGIAFIIEGLKAEPVTVTTRTVCYSDAAVDQAEYDYSLMPGYLYTVGDEFGNARTGILVKDVRPVRAIMTFPTSSVPSGVYALLDCEWVLQDTWY